MHRPTYALSCAIARFVAGMHVRHRIVHRERLQHHGPFIIACTHIGHLEPVLISSVLTRPVHWVARVEFYRNRFAAGYLNRTGTIPVNRNGVPVSTIRTAAAMLGEEKIVGIFPEGGRTHGLQQAIHGGPIKGGVCTIAMRAGVPIVPVVVLNIDAMHAVSNWMPGRRTTIQTLVGRPIMPCHGGGRIGRRVNRQQMTEQLAQAFIELYAESKSSSASDSGGRP